MGKSNVIVQFIRGVVILCFLVLLLVSPARAETVYFSDDFENGTSTWTISNGVWEIGVPMSGPGAAHSGQKVAATVLAGDYPANSNATMTLAHPIDLTGSVSPVLSYWHKDYMPYSYDVIYVQVSNDGGLS